MIVLIRRILAASLAAGSLLGLAVSLPKPEHGLSQWQKLTLGVAATALVLELAFAVADYRNNRIKAIKRDGKYAANIQRFMTDWLNRGGRAAIYTRDMTWAAEPDTRDVLLAKAAAGELVICVPSVPAQGIVADLRAAGATVHTYATLNHQPSARFTVINYGRRDAEVAIGMSDGDHHRIEELSSRNHPAAMLSLELIDLLASLPASAR